MKKSKILGLTLLSAGLLLSGTITSCNDGNHGQTVVKTITFKVQDENGEWKNYVEEVTIVDGKVSLPTNPTKKYYTFRGWFYDTNRVKEFKNEDLSEGATVYAYFVADEVNIYINGESQGTRDLIDVVNGTYNPGKDLTFDGWYTDSECKVKYKEGDPAKTLYAQSVATITFNNGYEDLYTTKVKPNTTLKNPSLDTVEVEGVTKTIEENNIVKSYMSNEDIYYVDDQGNEIDFNRAITKNTTIKVLWKSPFLKYSELENNSGNKQLVCLSTYGTFKGSDYSKTKLNNVPVISFPHKVTIVNKNNEKELREVNAVYIYDNNTFNSTALKKVIVQEGIKYIRGFSSSSGTSGVTSFELPSTLKIIQNCFNNLNITKESVNIPNGVEAIYASFFKGGLVNYNNEAETFYTGSEYDFDIDVPDSVKSLSIVPQNLKFSSKSTFKNEENMITQTTNKGKVLISYDNIDEYGTITVPEGIEGIQVGTFVNRKDLKRLVLPKSFKFVNYNLNLSDYLDCYAWNESTYINNECYLYDSQISENTFAYNARLIVSNLDSMEYLVFNDDVDESVYKAFGGNATEYSYYYGNFTTSDNEIYKDIKTVNLKETNTPLVKVNFINNLTGETYSISINRENQNAITYDEILAKLDAEKSTNYKDLVSNGTIKIAKTLNMSKEYDITSSIKSNLYLDIQFEYNLESAGVTYTTENEEVKITGFDADSAIYLSDGTCAIIIPDTIEGNKVTTIEKDAFLENGLIKIIKMGKNIKTIGDNAFKENASLSTIYFNDAKLKSIGESAFEDTALTSLSFSIESLKTVGNSAFKIETLEEFIPINEEGNRDVTTIKNGEFYFVKYDLYTSSKYVMLNQKVSSSTNTETNLTTYDIKMYTFCNATQSQIESISIGEDYSDKNYVVRYEIMTGAMHKLTLTNYNDISLQYVSKIHTNAITSSTISRKGIKYSSTNLNITASVSTIEDLVNALPDVFGENWIDNYDSIKTIKTAAL